MNSADTHRADTHRERRIARDGKAYTWPEFLEYYGESVAANSWNSADIHRAGDGSASSTVEHAGNRPECETATAVATEAQYRDDHTFYVYDRTTSAVATEAPPVVSHIPWICAIFCCVHFSFDEISLFQTMFSV